MGVCMLLNGSMDLDHERVGSLLHFLTHRKDISPPRPSLLSLLFPIYKLIIISAPASSESRVTWGWSSAVTSIANTHSSGNRVSLLAQT